MMIRIFSVCILLVFAIALPVTGQDTSAHQPKQSGIQHFDPKRDAANDIRDAIVLAQNTHRRILLDVGGEWCIWCRRLDTLFETHPELDSVRQAYFVTVKINYSKENENKEVLSKYPEIPGYPHFFVLDENGKLLKSQDTGELESGKHHDPKKVMDFLRKWGEQEEIKN